MDSERYRKPFFESADMGMALAVKKEFNVDFETCMLVGQLILDDYIVDYYPEQKRLVIVPKDNLSKAR